MLWTLIIGIALAFGAGAIFGAPYVPILKRDSSALLTFSELKSGDRFIDLGSGDGRLLKAAAQRGIYGIGYEINPLLYIVSRLVTWPERRLVTIHLANFWSSKLPSVDVIYVFLLDKYMVRLATKLYGEMNPDTILISYVFEVPEAIRLRSNHNTFVYRVGDLVVGDAKS
jgi:SAM-dependent methyltransferase